ncbi:MAG TPA: Stp1/IreP family PP2C-type Ser/Thr phosphatase [Candidatus Ozemobacteraceae bacterium]|nr:Stp1/IreP family PP2C-type Ser/Thr phosphatase [Candidatus Ozemobacteraceae bacterium]
MKFLTLSDKGSVRPNNEDYTEAVQVKWTGPLGQPDVLTALFLADGMGGAAAGEFASMLAVRTSKDNLLKALFFRPPEELLHVDLQKFLSDSCIQANTAIFAKATENKEMEGMGTTLVSAVIYRDILSIVHVGDSRAYLYREGKLQAITRDHSLVQELIDQGKITHEQAKIHPNRNIITRALGVSPNVEPEGRRIPLYTGDIIVICSDGLCGYVEDSTIQHNIESAEPGPKFDYRAVAENLIKVAIMAGGYDNVSVAVYQHVYLP